MSYISGEKQAPLQQVSFHSFPKTNFTFHELLLRNSHFPTTKEAWITLSVPERYPNIINSSMQWDSLSKTEVEAKTFAWNILTLKGQNRSYMTDKVHITGKGKEFRVQIIQISSWLVLRQECNRQSSLRKQLRDDYTAVVAMRKKFKVQGNNSTCTPHGNLLASRLTTGSFSTHLKTRNSERVFTKRVLSMML